MYNLISTKIVVLNKILNNVPKLKDLISNTLYNR